MMKKTEAIFLISKIRARADAFILQELAQHEIEGLAPSHGDILRYLYQNDSMTMTAIAHTIHRTKPTVTVLINKLVKLGMVKKVKSPGDSRSVLVELTAKGRSFKPVFASVSKSLTEKVCAGLSEEEIKSLEAGLKKLLANLE